MKRLFFTTMLVYPGENGDPGPTLLYQFKTLPTTPPNVDINTLIHVMDTTTSMADLEKEGIRLYPNPADGLLFLELDDNTSCQVNYTLTDMGGRTVASASVSLQQGRGSIDMTAVSSGMYVLTLKKPGGKAVYSRIEVKH